MTAEIISIGTELLMGQVVNTDAQFIAKHLAPLGYRVLYQVTVGDNPARLEETLRQALKRAEVIFLTGGLGPTEDDLTKETAARVLGKTLVQNPEETERLKAWFTGRNRTMTPNNLKQAAFPEDALILPNPRGTAPGCIMEKDGKALVLLPGPPRELCPMFTESVLPYLEERSGNRLFTRSLRFFGIGESALCYELRDLIDGQTNPTLATYCKTGEVELRVTALCRDDREGEALLLPTLRTVRERAGDCLYSETGEELAEVIVRLLTERHQTVAVSESCTGGMVSSALVDVPGCSDCFTEGLVTYSNEAKLRHLGVRRETLERCGAVSAECAAEMAEGLRRTGGTDYALSTTGIAGPGGGTPEKPVGLIYVGIASKEGTFVRRLELKGDRERNRILTKLNALDMLRRRILGLPL